MTRRRYIAAALAVVMLISATLSGFVGGATAQEGDRPTLRFGVNAADLATLDPHFASGTQDRTVVDMVFNGLVRFVPGNSAEIEPDLATAIPEPETVDGKQVWTFQIREGVMCHPGPDSEAYELTADDVVSSLQKSADSERSAFAGDYAGMTVEKVDDYTVAITMDSPLSDILFLPKVANYSGGFIVCAQAVDAMGDEAFKTHPVGTGPFMFENYTPQNSVVLVANDDYFRGAPKLGGVEVRYMPDTSSRELGLQAGELDVAAGLNEAQWVERINAEGNLIADVFGVAEAVFINLNVTQEPLDDPLVREAIALAVSPDEHAALRGAPVSENIYSVVPAQQMPGGLTAEEAAAAGVVYEQNLERARELLTEAGHPDGFTIDLVTSEMTDYRANYEVLQAELAEIGITLNLTVVDHATMHEQIREDVNPIVIYVAFRPNADVYLTNFFHSDSIVVDGASPITNFAHYSGVDDLIESARAETDPEAQAELWRRANIQIQKDLAALPLYMQNLVYARAQGVDYGHELISIPALYPQITELTTVER
ncbi:MAG: polyamine ABC transporter substrate-binding protein [Chloroflexia bacterium]|nr:polyamine ABC transporter substrate-binding protein [Chloroflexia bacterium]